MPHDDDTDTADAPRRNSHDGYSGTTRRRLLECGAAGIAASSLGSIASSPVGADHEENPLPAPENVQVEWVVGATVGVSWDWPGDPCLNDVDFFHVGVEHGDELDYDNVPAGRRAYAMQIGDPEEIADGPREVTIQVGAVDRETRRSELATLTTEIEVSDASTVLRPSPPESDAIGSSATVPVGFESSEHESLVRYELTASVGPSCSARIEDVSVPETLDLTVHESEFEADGSAVRVVAGGRPPDDLLQQEVLLVEVAGEAGGAPVLDVDVEELLFLQPDREYEEWQQLRDGSGAPDDVGFDDLVVDADATGRWSGLELEGSVAAPQNLDVGYWISTRVGLTWDMADGFCTDELSHFQLTAIDPANPTDASPLVEHQIPAERPLARVDTANLLDGDDAGSHMIVYLQAVDVEGRRSEPAQISLSGAIADPGYHLGPSSPNVTLDRRTPVEIDFHPVLGTVVSLVSYELTVEISAPCIATIEDVSLSNDDWELLETDWAEDGSAVTVSAEGPPEDSHGQKLANVEIAGHSAGETVIDVSVGDLVGVERVPPDIEFEVLVEEHGLTEEEARDLLSPERQSVSTSGNPSTVTVREPLPAVVGDRSPRDIDGDGHYRDVNGDGSVTNSDVTTFFQNQHTSVIDDYPDAYDFTGDGEVGQADVIDLFESL